MANPSLLKRPTKAFSGGESLGEAAGTPIAGVEEEVDSPEEGAA